ncbi:methionyl-tRNA formyltransferase [Rhodoferax sp. U2-2l]|uniref:methionyl-tRNA formyltransferase n=1 Tax=Rhodoferax sp. U2-2l TaxID=2884000 RepID=UPI001D0ABBD5|nr:methionyl-tRNA formyltransferase [Rhodoferax sp. U2-2l]MCB8746059.1 methionyl-tRNA formyltransferase [Rhodoferax sp. U2-2l]
MKLVFAGTPEFAAVALAKLLAAGHEVVLVLTQPDRPAGRGLKLQASPVKQLALQHGIPVAQPRSLRLDGKYPDDAHAAQRTLQAAGADAMVVAAYGLILPQWVLDVPKHGCFNIHGSLLPRWRGAAPIHRAIEAGDAQTGVTIMQMDAGLDTGDMLLKQAVPILDTDTTGSLHDQLADLGADLMVQALAQLQQGALRPVPQPTEGVTYAAKVDKAEASIDWSQSAQTITRRVRAFNPFPAASTVLNGEPLKVWSARVGAQVAPPDQVGGHIVSVTPEGIGVVAMDSVVLITELQRPGGKRLAVADFLRGCELRPGQRLGAA